MALREIIAEFDVDTGAIASKLAGVDQKLQQITGALGGLAEAFIGSAMVKGLSSFISGQIDAAKEVRLTAEKLGVSTDALEEWNFAASTAGVSAEGAANGLKFLNKNVGLALEGNKEAAQTFSKLGVSIKDANGDVREVGDILPEVADAFEKMGSQQERTAAAMKIFGRQGADLLPLLQGGSQKVDELRKRFYELGGGMSKDFIDRAKEAGKAIGGAKFGMNAWKRTIAFEMFPAVKAFGDKAQWLIQLLMRVTAETHLAKEAAGALGIGAALALFKIASGAGKLLGLVPKGASLWETLLGMGELGLIIAGVLALALGFEDLYTWISGGDSVTGDLIESLFGVGASAAAIDQVKAIFADFADEVRAFKPIIDELTPLFSGIFQEAIPWIKEAAKFILGSAAAQLTTFLQIVRAVIGEIGAGAQLIGGMAAKAGEFLGNDKLASMGAAFEKTGAGLSAASDKGAAGGKVFLPVDSQQRAYNGGPANQQNEINITVQGGENPKETGAAVRDGVRQGLTESQNDNTLAAINTGA